MKKIKEAIDLAGKAHFGQRYGKHPYLYHLTMVAEVAERLGFDEEIICACWLHDTLEDTKLTYYEIIQRFGTTIADIVYDVTDELGRSRGERKAKTYPKIKANYKAVIVKLCDRISNLQECKEDECLAEMYLKEHNDFRRGLMSKDHPHELTNKAWQQYNMLIENLRK